jgi:hypothetical protein
MSCTIGILSLYSDTIINTENDITYNRGSNESLTTTLDMSLNEISKILYDQLGWNAPEIKVEITWRMMQTEVSLIHYVGVPIYSNESLNSMFGFASINGMNIL